MAQRYNVGDRVALKVDVETSKPSQTLPAGSKGTIKQKFIDNMRYRIQFDDRPSKTNIVLDSDLRP